MLLEDLGDLVLLLGELVVEQVHKALLVEVAAVVALLEFMIVYLILGL
jgi:hypothetical protein